MKRGDIVTVAPPREFGEPRPALIIQSDFAFDSPYLIYIAITRDLERVPDVRVPIAPSKENGLRLPSEIMVDVIQTAPREKFSAVIGYIDPVTLTLVEGDSVLAFGVA